MELFFLSLALIAIVAVGAYLYGRLRYGKKQSDAKAENLDRVLDGMKRTDEEIKDMSDSDLDKHI